MRIVNLDPKLGISKVVWKFTAEPEAETEEEMLQSQRAEEPAGPIPAEIHSEDEQTDFRGHGQPEIRNEHLEDLRKQISFLQQVVENQNQQLKTKDELIRNFQVLLKTEQELVLKLESGVGRKPGDDAAEKSDGNWFQTLLRKRNKQQR